MTDRELIRLIKNKCWPVYRKLGRGMIERAYQLALDYELRSLGLDSRMEVPISMIYGDMTVENAFKADIVVNDRVIIELKAVPELLGSHHAQLSTYMQLSGIPHGILVNFHEADFYHEGIYYTSLNELRRKYPRSL